MKIGFIGLGIMGGRMAANLQKHGYDLIVFNRTRAKARQLREQGATIAESAAQAASQVDVLFTMLSQPEAVEQTALGADGFLNHLRPNSIWIDCSTVNPSFSKRMAAEATRRKVRFLDAPVSGSAPLAADGKLTFWIGGEGADLEEVRSLLLYMGNRLAMRNGHAGEDFSAIYGYLASNGNAGTSQQSSNITMSPKPPPLRDENNSQEPKVQQQAA